MARDASSPSPPARSHACAFATPPPFAGSEAARDAYETGASVRTDVYVLGGYAGRVGRRDDDETFSKNAGALRNDLWRLDTSTFCWSCPEAIGDVPSPRRDAAVAVTPVSRSGLGRVFLHGGAAADGEPLADFYALDLGSLAWTRLPPGDQVLASDPYEAARRDPEDFALEPEFVVALEIADALEERKQQERKKRGGEEDARAPPTQTPRRRRRRGARVVVATRARARATPPRWWARRWSCTADARARAGRRCGPLRDRSSSTRRLYARCEETMSWRSPRVAADADHPAPPADRCVGARAVRAPGRDGAGRGRRRRRRRARDAAARVPAGASRAARRPRDARAGRGGRARDAELERELRARGRRRRRRRRRWRRRRAPRFR